MHPSVFILYKCMVVRLSCLSSQFPYFVIAISHLLTYPNTPTVFPHLLSASVLPPFPLSHSRTYLRSLSLFIYWSLLFCFAQIVYVRCVLTIGNLLFGWTRLVRVIIQTFKVRSFGLDKNKSPLRTAAFGCLNTCTRTCPQIRQSLRLQ